MTAFELMEIGFLLREEAQRHFEYWLTISFAFIAATFVARKMLDSKMATMFGALYLLTVALLVARYVVSGSAADTYLDLAVQQGAEPIGGTTIVTYLRVSVFLSGTFLAIWFLYSNSRNREDDK